MTAPHQEPSDRAKAVSETTEPAVSAVLPDRLRAFLSAPELAEVWRTIRIRLERNGLVVDGAASVELDGPAASAL